MRTSDRGRLAVRVTAAALCAGLILLVTGARDEPLGLALLAGVQGLGMLAVLWHRSGRREQQVWAPLAAGSLLLVVTDLPSLAAAPGVTAPGASTLVGALAGCTLWYVGALALLRQRLRSVLAYAALDMLGGVVTMTALAWALAARPLAETVGVPMSTAFALLVAPSATLLLAVFAVTGMFLGGGLRDLRMIASAIAYLLFTLVAMAPAVLPADDHLGPLGAHLLTAGAQVCVLLLLGAASTLPTPSAVVRRDEGRLATQLSPTIFSVVNACLLVACAFDLVPREVAVVACSGLLFTLFKLGTVFRNVTTLNDTRRQAESDELTGLANRRALVQELARSESARTAGLALFDLDRFKDVNDSYGHAAGDELLRQVGARLRSAVRPDELAVRLGGDEFAVLLRELPTDETMARIRRIAAELTPPFELEEGRVHLRSSVGVTVTPDDGPAGTSLLHRADVAMYEMKQRGGGVGRYEPSADDERRRQLELVEQLRTAVYTDQLVVHYQPQVAVADGRTLVGAEALVRWLHPEHGPLTPDEFLPLAERHGLMFAITHNVMSQALDHAATWRRVPGHDRLVVSVNVSAASLADPKLVPLVEGLLDEFKLDGSALQVEITESELMHDPRTSLRAATALERLGVRVSIDDYGTGYSSLAYLRDLPAAELKLDRSFVRGVVDDPRAAAIVRNTVDLAHTLGLHLVAEGVEDDATLALLRTLGADVSQGYLHGRPMDADAFADAHVRPVALAVPTQVRGD
ncbi:putative bifunctional diguanylate cyclase/phosphodiesterase [Angustibacter aerolatus]